MTQEDVVKVDISVKEDIYPHYVREGQAVNSDDNGVFGPFDIEQVISSEGKSACNIGVECTGRDGSVSPQIHRFVWEWLVPSSSLDPKAWSVGCLRPVTV